MRPPSGKEAIRERGTKTQNHCSYTPSSDYLALPDSSPRVASLSCINASSRGQSSHPYSHQYHAHTRDRTAIYDGTVGVVRKSSLRCIHRLTDTFQTFVLAKTAHARSLTYQRVSGQHQVSPPLDSRQKGWFERHPRYRFAPQRWTKGCSQVKILRLG